MMKNFLICIWILNCFAACSQKKKEQLTAPPSVSAVQSTVTGKTFMVERVGTVSPFAAGIDKEKPYNWFDEEKELNDFAKKYKAEREKFKLQFVNDTLAKITDDGKTWDAVYSIDTEKKDDEKAGIKLRFTYPDKEGTMNFPGATSPMIMTYTYLVTGMNDKELILETPRQFNRSTVVVWMKQQ